MRRFIVLFLVMSTFHVWSQVNFDTLNLAPKHKQLVVVISDSWSSNNGVLKTYNYEDGKWNLQELTFPVMLGKNGLAWGIGLHAVPEEVIQKKEGDGKSPAGIFSVAYTFGYDEQPIDTTFEYKKCRSRDYFVDDVKSTQYNTWQSIPLNKANSPKLLWSSYEVMKRNDHLYKHGFLLNHNTTKPISGGGSAIFYHVWRAKGKPTLGCTSTSEHNLKALLAWLDAKKSPLVIQVPKSDIDQLQLK